MPEKIRLISAALGGLLGLSLSLRIFLPHTPPVPASWHRSAVEAVVPHPPPAQEEAQRWSVWATGRVEALRQSVVGTKVAGRVSAYVKHEGDQVQAGEVVVLLEREEQRARRVEALAKRAQALRDLQRATTLRRGRVIAKRELEQAETAYELADAELATAQAALQDRVVRAPFAGRVLKTSREAGESVAAGAALFVLGDLSGLKVRAEIDELDLGGLSAGARARIFPDSMPKRSFRGRVSSLSGILGRKTQLSDDPRERTDAKVLEAEIRLDDNSGLVPGMNVKVEILADDDGR